MAEHTPTVEPPQSTSVRPIVCPQALLQALPLPARTQERIERTRTEIARILNGQDDRLLVVVGPCSIHDVQAAKDYASRLQPLAKTLKDDLLIVMRVYFEKPRTTVGWKGLINDPTLDHQFDINSGLQTARGLLVDLANMGLPVATEFLDTITPVYISDTISWGAIGARTTESQVHRELASGLGMPVGFKNGRDGNVQIALDAMGAAANEHHYLAINPAGEVAIVHTEGNPNAHVILRGSYHGPNYQPEHVAAVQQKLTAQGCRVGVMVDCSHGNSQRDYRQQPEVAKAVMQQLATGSSTICGVMMESFLQPGRQELQPGQPLTYGVSITDGCMGWDDTEPLLAGFARSVQQRRQHHDQQAE